jgi:hypothetical protein
MLSFATGLPPFRGRFDHARTSSQVAGRGVLKSNTLKNRPETISYSEPVAIKFGVRRPAVRAGHTPNFALAAMLATLPLHKKENPRKGIKCEGASLGQLQQLSFSRL